MHAAARDELEGAPDSEAGPAGAGLDGVAVFTGTAGVAGVAGAAMLPVTPSGFASSFFHIGHLDIENWIFEVAHRRAGWNCDSEE
jgi:hypothetical protein